MNVHKDDNQDRTPIEEFLDSVKFPSGETYELEVDGPSIEEIRLRVLELVLQYGKPMSGSTEKSPVVAMEKIRELARFFEEYVVNG